MINKIFNNSVTMMVILCLVLLVVSILVLNWAAGSTMDSVEWEKETYRVRSGDSLWEISGEYCPDSVDRREWINEVRDLNGLKGNTIRAGQRLTVLAPAR